MKKLQKQLSLAASQILDRRFITGLVAGILVALFIAVLLLNHRAAQLKENWPPTNIPADVSSNSDDIIWECDYECENEGFWTWGWCMLECVVNK